MFDYTQPYQSQGLTSACLRRLTGGSSTSLTHSNQCTRHRRLLVRAVEQDCRAESALCVLSEIRERRCVRRAAAQLSDSRPRRFIIDASNSPRDGSIHNPPLRMIQVFRSKTADPHPCTQAPGPPQHGSSQCARCISKAGARACVLLTLCSSLIFVRAAPGAVSVYSSRLPLVAAHPDPFIHYEPALDTTQGFSGDHIPRRHYCTREPHCEPAPVRLQPRHA